MKTIIKSLTASFLAGIAFITLCGTARADLTVSNSTTIATWNQVGGQSPFYVTSLSGISSQGSPGLGSGATYTVLSETFTITNGAGSLANGTTNYTLTGIAIVGGNQPANSSIHVFDVTATLTSNNGTPLQGSGATYDFVANGDLLGGGFGLTLTNLLGGEDQILYNLTTGPGTDDQIVLGAGHTYAFEIWAPSGGTYWYRSSNADPGGEAMGSANASLGVARLTITSLGLAGGAPRTFTLALYGSPTSAAPSVNNNTNNVVVTNYVIDVFNSFGYGPTNQYVGTNDYSTGGIINVWTNWNGYGTAWVTNQWDSSSDANGNSPNSGSLKITATFPGQYAVFDGFNGIKPPLSCYSNGITSFQCDLRFDPSSAITVNSGTSVTNYGHLQIGMQINGSGQDYWTAIEIPVGTTNWVHETIPLSLSTDPNLFTINDVVFHIDGNWYGSHALSGTSILWVDNVKFVGPATFTLPPAPTMSIQKTTPALRMFAGSTANTYDRVEVATVDQSQSWIGGGSVSYSFTLLSYPANIGQTMIFLVPVNTAGSQGMYNNEYIEYQAANALWLNIQPYGGGGATASIEWKTNLPNANPTNILVVLTNSTAVGTWTLTFTSASGGTVTAPGGNQAAFTIADPNVATDFANPLVAYFGLQPNSTAGEGEYEDWGSISVTGVAGVKENDNFTTDTSFNSGLWNINTLTVALNSCVQLVTTNTPYWVSWTLPAVNFGLGTASDIRGSTTTAYGTQYPWVLPEYYNSYNDGNTIPNQANQGSKTWVLVPSTCLPTVDGSQGGVPSKNAFFQLFNPPLAN
jgi:hypothetical protein